MVSSSPFFVILDNDWVLEEWKMFALQSEQHLTLQNARAYGPYRLFDFKACASTRILVVHMCARRTARYGWHSIQEKTTSSTQLRRDLSQGM